MSSLETRKIEPATGTTVTLGAGGDTVLVSADQLKTNTVKDSGGNTLFTSDGAGTLSSVNSALSGSMIFISSQTASTSTSVSFTTGIDSTYDEYVFTWINVVPSSNNHRLGVNFSSDGGSNFNVTKTTTYFSADHSEDNSTAGLQAVNAADLAQSTDPQRISDGVSTSGGDESTSGMLYLFGPSSTTFVKQFYSVGNAAGGAWMTESFAAGYCNTTSAVDGVQFAFIGGETMATGTIAMYGIS